MNLNLDIARGVAALSVFLFHIKGVLEYSLPALAKIMQFGSLGVPLFFVISGYVITASAEMTLSKKRSSSSFLKRRFIRIFPPFWISILVVILFPYLIAAISFLKSGQYIFPQPRYIELTNMEWIQLISFIKVFMSENGDLQAQFNQVNSVYWTLAIEFQFYLCVYVALLFRQYSYVIISTVTLISLLLILYPLKLNPGLFIHFWPMFVLGGALFYIIRRGVILENMFPKHNRIIAIFIVVLFIGLVIILSYLGVLTQVLASIFPSSSLGFALICFFILWSTTPLEEVLEGAKNGTNIIFRYLVKAGAFLGVISYSLYLLHGKILELPTMFARQLIPLDSALFPLFIVVGTIAISTVFYFFFEKPFMSNRQKKNYDEVLISTLRES